jgi:hypothetical protein
MDNTILKRVSYRELRDGISISLDDSCHMVSDYLTPSVRSTLLANPNLNDYTNSVLNLVVLDGTVVGRNMMMPTKLKVGDTFYQVQSGGSYEVSDQYRGHGFGTMAFKDTIMNSEYSTYIGQLYSTSAISIVKKLGLIVFELPSFYKLCRSRTILESRGLRGVTLKICATIADGALKVLDIPNRCKLNNLRKKYTVKEVKVIPEWVNEITLHDGHEYMEVHDSNWLQWCLDNRFTESPQDGQKFYAVYDKEGKPIGFFMTKVRFEREQGQYKNIKRGTVVEWGSNNENELDEIDVNLLATYSFDPDVDNITTVLSNPAYEQRIKKLGFMRHGNYQLSIKPGNLKRDNITDQSKWRIRYGGCNTIVF